MNAGFPRPSRCAAGLAMGAPAFAIQTGLAPGGTYLLVLRARMPGQQIVEKTWSPTGLAPAN